MRLIDADELIKAIEQGEGFSWDSHGKDDLCVRKKYIDNAPTVEERPQGERSDCIQNGTVKVNVDCLLDKLPREINLLESERRMRGGAE